MVYFLTKIFSSDTIGNKGAFITMTGKSMIPTFTTYEAVVSVRHIFDDLFIKLTLSSLIQT